MTPQQVAGVTRDWVSYPGIFAAGRLDEGTALLLGVLPPLAPRARVLDYGCGSGVIGAAALALEPTIALDTLDSDAVALEAVRENVPGARRILGTRIADANKALYQVILSNPPAARGSGGGPLARAADRDAPRSLAPGGVLQIVGRARTARPGAGAATWRRRRWWRRNGRYRVWRAARRA